MAALQLSIKKSMRWRVAVTLSLRALMINFRHSHFTFASLLLCAAWGPVAAWGAEDPSVQNCQVIEGLGEGHLSIELEREQLQRVQANRGKVISDVVFRNIDVFNESLESENNWLYRSLNKLHYNTREDVIADQLLFEAGERLDPDDITESERLLRSREYMANTHIGLSKICENSVEVIVFTQDAWTTEPQLSFGHTGGETSSGFALAEGNIFGTGSSVSIGYFNDAERSGIAYRYSTPHFLNTRLAGEALYSDNSDGEDYVFRLAYPFFSLRTPRSYGISTQKVAQTQKIRFKGDVVDEFRHHVENHQAYYGEAVRIDKGDTHRLLFGVTQEIDNFEMTPETVGRLPENRELLYPWVEYQFLEHEYGVFHNLDQIQRIEDIAMGKELVVRVGYGGETFSNPDDVLRYLGHYSDILEMDEDHVVKFSGNFEGRYHSYLEDRNTSVVGGQVSYYWLEDNNNRWYARLRYDVGNDLARHEKLSVGGTVGVRGYALDYQRGDQRYIFSLERRFYSDIHLFNLVHLGAVAFFDAGRAWDGELQNNPKHLSNIGFGLRGSSSKAKIGHIVHLDIAFPLADREHADNFQVLVKAEQAF